MHVCEQLLQTQYSPNDWNIYLFQFSDGDNFASDNDRSLEIIQHALLPAANLYCYGQVDQRHYSDSFKSRCSPIWAKPRTWS